MKDRNPSGSGKNIAGGKDHGTGKLYQRDILAVVPGVGQVAGILQAGRRAAVDEALFVIIRESNLQTVLRHHTFEPAVQSGSPFVRSNGNVGMCAAFFPASNLRVIEPFIGDVWRIGNSGDEDWTRTVAILHKKEAQMTEAALDFLEFLLDYYSGNTPD